ncbi:hypothetical protein GWI33_010409 [Rhynchophorus ferrugineus]|uniref:Uncharacterized protein n=1 Tax=Rhynchophorus ferrugineus TaxID=354439 RepID=A0A834ISB6_RHYFE|nr:hypothetical protein GWI33_010409 [Rhynchophorus ferrugineus]
MKNPRNVSFVTTFIKIAISGLGTLNRPARFAYLKWYGKGWRSPFRFSLRTRNEADLSRSRSPDEGSVDYLTEAVRRTREELTKPRRRGPVAGQAGPDGRPPNPFHTLSP